MYECYGNLSEENRSFGEFFISVVTTETYVCAIFSRGKIGFWEKYLFLSWLTKFSGIISEMWSGFFFKVNKNVFYIIGRTFSGKGFSQQCSFLYKIWGTLKKFWTFCGKFATDLSNLHSLYTEETYLIKYLFVLRVNDLQTDGDFFWQECQSFILSVRMKFKG